MKFFIFLKIFLFLFSNKIERNDESKKLCHAIEASFLNKIQLESSESNK